MKSKKTVYVGIYEYENMVADGLKEGAKVCLYSDENELTHKKEYSIVLDDEGISGNMDATKKKCHGWRGTTNGWSRDAHGIREVKAIWQYDSETMGIELSADLYPEKD